MATSPNLPGFRSNKTVAKPRNNKFTWDVKGEQHRDGDWYTTSSPGSTSMRSETKDQFLAKSRLLDKTILCFNAFWREEVFDSNERFRFRFVRIFYVVEDGSLKVSERKSENSGLLQGVFLKRGRVPKREGGYISLEDLKIGEDIVLYNRTFTVCGCTPETRDWLVKQGVDVPADMDRPEDDFTKRMNSQVRESNKLQKTAIKVYVEASCGKAVGSVEKLGSFLKHGRKVLRFYAYWDDRASLYGDLNRYILHYFLADDTIEIREVKTRNSGKAEFSLLLGRTKLPKEWKDEVHQVDKSKDPSRFVGVKDLYVGAKVQVFGRDLVLTQCDGFTKRWYSENMGMKEESFVPIKVEDEVKEFPKMDAYTPHFGGVACFGTDEDSLQSCLSLHPKPIKKDIEKLMVNQKNLLRYAARLDTTKPEDIDRKFVVTYYMADDTMAVFEDVPRNSGRMPGKFLRRMKVQNEKTGKYFVPEDFKAGTIVTINKFRFIIDGMDTFTMRFTVDVKATLRRLHAGMVHHVTDEHGNVAGNSSVSMLKQIFGAIDRDGSGYVTAPEFEKYIREKLHEKLSDSEIAAVMHFFDTDGDGRVSQEEFKVWLTSDPNKWGPISGADSLGNFAGAYTAKLQGAVASDMKIFAIKVAIKRYAMAFHDKTHDFLQIFQKFDKWKTGEVTRDGFVRALEAARKFASGGIDETYPEMIANYLFNDSCRFLDYNKFLKFLEMQSVPPVR